MKKINSGEKLLNKLYKNLYLEYEKDNNLQPTERITKLLNRLEKVTAKAIQKDKYDMLKEMYYNKYVIKEIPESYYRLQEEIAFNRGHGRIVYNDEMRNKAKNIIINDQKASLDEWLDYLSSSDAIYPTWAKYWAFQGMLKMGSYDKENQKFTKRTKITTNPFIDINREVLALSIDCIQNFINEDIKTDDNKLNELIEIGSFQKIYEHIYITTMFQKQNNSSNEGIWVKYDKGSDHVPLVKSLVGKGTGWCTAGESTAKIQLYMGDFYVFYTKNESGEYTNPRIAIRMERNSIAEIRGVAKNQNLEPLLEDVLEEKLNEFPDKEIYLQKNSDMKLLTEIYEKTKLYKELTKEDILFLYEIESEIKGFGYKKDPRIEEIKAPRSLKKDISFALDCNEDEVGIQYEDLFTGKKLKCYIGNISSEDIERKGFMMPEMVVGDLLLDDIITAKGLTLPTTVNGNVCLDGLITAKGLILPITLNGNLCLGRLTAAEGLILPTILNGELCLDGLITAKGLILPTTLNGNLYLDGLITAKGLILPSTLNGDLYLTGLITAKELILPTIFNGDLYLSVTTAKGLVLSTINGNVYLSLTTAKGLVLSARLNGWLHLNTLENLNGIIIDDNFQGTGTILYQNANYSVEEFKEKVRSENAFNYESVTRSR